MDRVQGMLIKTALGLAKNLRNSPLLAALVIEKIEQLNKRQQLINKKLLKVNEKCTNFYFGTEKLRPNFYDLISIVKKFCACWPPNRFSV